MPTLCSSRKYPYPRQGDGHWKFRRGRGVISITQVFKRKYDAILEIPGGRRVQSKEPSFGEVWILFGTTHFN